MRIQCVAYLIPQCFLWSSLVFALDSTQIPLQAPTPVSQTSPVTPTSGGNSFFSTYYFMDIYNGTMPTTAGIKALPTGTSIQLSFYNNGKPTLFATPLSCGDYQIVYNVGLIANTNVAQVTVTPLITSTAGTIPLSPVNFTFYPQCNNTSFSSTPYCTVSEFSGSAAYAVPANQSVTVSAPSITASSSVSVAYGYFYIYLVDTTNC